MFIRQLETRDASVRLIKPSIDRDAALGVQWMAGQPGRDTLALMGVADADNSASTLEQETGRVQGFLDRQDELYWMIEDGGAVVGTAWVDLSPTDHIQAPAVSIMIGDPAARGKGIGGQALTAILAYLGAEGHERVFARHLVNNRASQAMLTRAGFKPHGKPYTDSDQLAWQNVSAPLVDGEA